MPSTLGFPVKARLRRFSKKVEKEIDSILADERLLYVPSKFEKKLLEKLRGLWDKLPTEIGGLLLKLIQTVDQAFEDGYLYLTRYDTEDEYFESETVNDYIFRFVSSLPTEMKASYTEELRILLEGGTLLYLSQPFTKAIHPLSESQIRFSHSVKNEGF